jgi:hypothetical protein
MVLSLGILSAGWAAARIADPTTAVVASITSAEGASRSSSTSAIRAHRPMA